MQCQTFSVIASVLVTVSFHAMALGQERHRGPYDFRDSQEFRDLPTDQQAKLFRVDSDLRELEAALQRYIKDHGGAPLTLAVLIPRYLKKLPEDPFATMVSASASKDELAGYQPSLKGWGYQFRRENAFCFRIQSVGLRGFPYRQSSKTAAGLYRSQGYRHGFILDVF